MFKKNWGSQIGATYFSKSARPPLSIPWLTMCLLPHTFSKWHRLISDIIPNHTWFLDLDLPRRIMIYFSRLNFGYNLLPFYTLCDYPSIVNFIHFYSLRLDKIDSNVGNIIFNYYSLAYSRLTYFSHLSQYGFSFSAILNVYLIIDLSAL